MVSQDCPAECTEILYTALTEGDLKYMELCKSYLVLGQQAIPVQVDLSEHIGCLGSLSDLDQLDVKYQCCTRRNDATWDKVEGYDHDNKSYLKNMPK